MTLPVLLLMLLIIAAVSGLLDFKKRDLCFKPGEDDGAAKRFSGEHFLPSPDADLISRFEVF